jgi:hypothetical protein
VKGSFALSGLDHLPLFTPGLRPGLQSCAASRLVSGSRMLSREEAMSKANEQCRR